MCQNMYLPMVLMVAIFASNGITRSHGQIFRSIVHGSRGRSGNPCRPTPCGPNTSCTPRGNGVVQAECRCLVGFVPDRNTVHGCKPQCTRDNDCPSDYRCQATKCVKVCGAGACGVSAECEARNHRAICKCPRGYQGQPEIRCTFNNDPCYINRRSVCGENAQCSVQNRQAKCSCPRGFDGNPRQACYPRIPIVAGCRGRCPSNRNNFLLLN